MKLNYNKLKELNEEALIDNERSQLSCYYVIQIGVEKFLTGDVITEEHKNLLLELGVLELTEEEIISQSIVGPFNFKKNGSTNS
jgi:hypothetical protein